QLGGHDASSKLLRLSVDTILFSHIIGDFVITISTYPSDKALALSGSKVREGLLYEFYLARLIVE
ncbi:MAG: hypothetical protein ACRD8U_05565, partial [Pyrinomonadaceae bacterium]